MVHGRVPTPIPRHPLHLCPNCDYNLTGLTSRRCPECGLPFTLDDARTRAIEQDPDMRGILRVQRGTVVRLCVGIGLILLSMIAGGLRARGMQRFPVAVISFPPFWAAATFLSVAVLLKMISDIPFSKSVFVIGLLVAVLTVWQIF